MQGVKNLILAGGVDPLMRIFARTSKKERAYMENRELAAAILLEIALDQERGLPVLIERVDEIEQVKHDECGVLYKTTLRILVALGGYVEHGKKWNAFAK